MPVACAEVCNTALIGYALAFFVHKIQDFYGHWLAVERIFFVPYKFYVNVAV